MMDGSFENNSSESPFDMWTYFSNHFLLWASGHMMRKQTTVDYLLEVVRNADGYFFELYWYCLVGSWEKFGSQQFPCLQNMEVRRPINIIYDRPDCVCMGLSAGSEDDYSLGEGNSVSDKEWLKVKEWSRP